MDSLTLTQLASLVQEAISLQFADFRPWVTAEVASMSIARHGVRHCYLELVDTAEGSPAITARIKANIWASTFQQVERKLAAMGGARLQEGMKVMLQVEVNFHPRFGLALVVHDIEPTYTLGDFARRREQIFQQLAAEHLEQCNKRYALPRPLTHIAVISSDTAAGYGDFCKQVEQSGLPFRLGLFRAAMQGAQTSESVCRALDEIIEQCAEGAPWQCVCILRGGGSVTDLASFDDYALARAICLYELPVITAIGHERDQCVLDLVAHTSLKTPTAAAAFLISLREKEVQCVQSLEERLQKQATWLLTQSRGEIDRLRIRLRGSALQALASQRAVLLTRQARLATLVPARLELLRSRLEHLDARLPQISASLLRAQRQRLEAAARVVDVASPCHLLKLGYSITRTEEGRVVRRPEEAPAGTVLLTETASGTLQSVVKA